MKASLTTNTFIAFLTVVTLAGAALGLADETEAMLNPAEMAKLGIHKMPNGEWMQEAAPAAAGDAAPTGSEHNGHGSQPEAAPDDNTAAEEQSPPAQAAPQQHEMPDGQMMDHEMMGH